ncbi:MAG: hypothetical protein ABH808_02905 [Candidatus Kuenenbacteria bacterium]
MKNINKNLEYHFGIISDTQDSKEPEEIAKILEPLHNLEKEGIRLDFIIHLGDLAGAGLKEYFKEAKRVMGYYDDEEKTKTIENNESKQYKETINSSEYKEFANDLKNKGVEQEIAIYALWLAKKCGKFDQALKNMELLLKNATDQLKGFKSEVRHIIGNADRAFPEKLEATQKLLKEQNITSYDQPFHLSLDEKTSVVFFPSMKIDKKNKEQILNLQRLIDKFAEDMKNKKTVLIFAHETPFRGPKQPGVYENNIKKKLGDNILGSDRIPNKQFLPGIEYALELIRRLPPDAKIAMTAGHMHVPREIIEAGTQYIKFDETGKAKIRLHGLGKKIDRIKYKIIPGSRRTFDLYYFPKEEVGILEIKDDGNIKYCKLSKNKN